MVGFITILDYLSTCVFAYNGTKTTLKYTSSLILSVLFGIITAVGGGTIRDTVHNHKPFWMEKPNYILLSILFGLLAIITSPNTKKR